MSDSVPGVMTLDGFRRDMHEKVEKFAEHWRKQHDAHPKSFPLEFKAEPPVTADAYWVDEFIAFTGLRVD